MEVSGLRSNYQRRVLLSGAETGEAVKFQAVCGGNGSIYSNALLKQGHSEQGAQSYAVSMPGALRQATGVLLCSAEVCLAALALLWGCFPWGEEEKGERKKCHAKAFSPPTTYPTPPEVF